MDAIIPRLSRSIKRRLTKKAKGCKDARLKTRYLIVLELAEGRRPADVAKSQAVSRGTVYRVAARFREWNEAGLVDRREENGQIKLDEEYLSVLYKVVEIGMQNGPTPAPNWDPPGVQEEGVALAAPDACQQARWGAVAVPRMSVAPCLHGAAREVDDGHLSPALRG